MWRILLVLIISIALQGCINAAVTGAQAVYDKNNIRNSLNDHYITIQANRLLNEDDRFQQANIAVATFQGVVLLTGQAPDPRLRLLAQKKVERIPDVVRVYNQISLSKPSSSLTQASDAWITTKIKSQFIASDIINPSQIKVVTENGTVYLMGTVLPSQANEAVTIARTTEGVQNVVKIFTYLRIIKSN